MKWEWLITKNKLCQQALSKALPLEHTAALVYCFGMCFQLLIGEQSPV